MSINEIPVLPPGVKVVRLDNGLNIIIREDHSAPVVSAQAWAMTGSIDEDKWLGAGLSHVLEHMLFKGTKTRGSGRIDQEVQEAGGYMNAYTSFDRTVYWINVPNTGARVAIDILCDIMQNASLPGDELAKEMDVIRREMDMGQDDPGSRASRRLFEVAYTKSPYRFTIIGYLDIFNRLRPDDIRAYYEERYAPNNCFYVIVGDINAGEVEKQIREAYAASKEKPLPPVVLPEEPRQIAPRVVIEEASIELGHFHFCWHIPDIRHADIPVLDVLAVLLGNGRSSRLYREVREKQGLVNYCDAWTYNPGRPGVFGMSAVVDADKFEGARDAMLAEIARMQEQLVAPPELAKAVKQFVSATLASRKTMQGQAQDLGGNWLAANDLNFSARYLAAVQRITPADLQRVALHYLTPENRTLYALLPEGTSPQEAAHVESSTDNAVQKIDLPNGLRLLVKPDHRLPFVEFRAVLRGGLLSETAADNGITQMLAKMMVQGTARRSAEQIAEEIESVGGHVDAFGGNNSLGVSAEVMKEDFDIGLDMLADVLRNPAFPADALERERQIQLSAIRGRNDELLRLCGQLMRSNLFGDEGYGLDSLGTEKSIAGLNAAKLKAFHARLVVPQNCVLAIYGDVQVADVKTAVEKMFGNWNRNGAGDFGNSKSQPVAAKTIRHVSQSCDKKQAVLVVGFPGTTMFDIDRYALELMQEACSDLGSRLFLRIREKLGLAYYVGAQHMPGYAPGYFAFYTGTEPSKAAQVEEEMFKEVELLRREGLDADELKRAKAKIVGQKKIARQELGSLAMTTALDELYGLGFHYADAEDARYEAVTLEQVKAVAQKYLRPEAAVVACVKPE